MGRDGTVCQLESKMAEKKREKVDRHNGGKTAGDCRWMQDRVHREGGADSI